MKLMVNKARAYGSNKWTNKLMAQRLLRAYTIRDTTLVSIIRRDPKLKRMTLEDILGRIINHEFLLEEARYVKNLSKGIVSTKKDVVALKASKKSKKKQIQIESSSEEEQDEDEDEEDEEEYDEDDMALFIKKFNKYISKRRPFKGDKKEKTRSKRVCYNCGKMGILLLNVLMRGKMKTMTRKRRRTKAKRKTRSSQRRSLMEKLILIMNGTQVVRAPSRKVMTWQPYPSRANLLQASHSFPISQSTLVLWQRKAKKKIKTDTPTSPKYITSDEYTLSSDDNNASSDDNGSLSQVNFAKTLMI
jgi:NACalpha-BTF3-like transcription factor